MVDFDGLHNMDKDIHSKIKSTFQTIKENISIFGMTLPFVDIKLAGSSQEGCFSSRYFQPDSDFSDNIHRMIEVDVEIIVFKISDEYRDRIEEIRNKPGFLRIRMNDTKSIPDEIQTLSSKFKTGYTIHDFISEDGYLSSYKIKEAYGEDMRFGGQHKYSHTSALLAAFLTNQPLRNINISNPMQTISKAVTTFSWGVFVNNALQWKVSFDFALVLQLHWAPSILEEYRNRRRKWPSMKELEKEMESVYVIAKSSHEERHNSESIEFRYSFAALERKLVSLQSENQRKIYLVFKSIMYKWIKPTDPVKISSFIAKNVMLWVCEEKPPVDILWNEDKLSIVNAIRYLFKKLQKTFETGFMPYIFIPNINVLQHLSKYTLRKAATLTKEISLNPMKYIPGEAGKIVNLLQNVINIGHKIEDITNEVINYGPDVLPLIRPDLFDQSKYLNEFFNNLKQPQQHDEIPQETTCTTRSWYQIFIGTKICHFVFPWYLQGEKQ